MTETKRLSPEAIWKIDETMTETESRSAVTGDQRSEIAALIARLEAAECWSRELDGDVFEAINGVSARTDTPSYREGRNPNSRLMTGIPQYTASIDAAMAIIPGGWEAMLYTETKVVELYPTNVKRRPAGIQARGNAVNLAVAICIAALAARNIGSSTGQNDDRTAGSDGGIPS